MSNLSRKLERNKLKKEQGNNKIQKAWKENKITIGEYFKDGKKHNRTL